MQAHPKKSSGFPFIAIILALIAGGVFLYLRSGAGGQPADAAGNQGPALQVEVQEMHPQTVRQWKEFSGRLSAIESVEIRPQVSGRITQILFKEGQVVEKGAPLFEIDPRPFQAAAVSAAADLASAHAQEVLTLAELKRAQSLAKSDFASKSLLDERRRNYQVAVAAVKTAEAKLAQAKLNVEYAHITAPVKGKISRAEITEGNVVQAGASAPVLASIVSNDRFYAEFDVDEQTFVQTVRGAAGGAMPVEMTLPSEGASAAPVVYRGNILAFDNQIDTATGTIRARAVFDNSDGALVPGMYISVRMGEVEAQPHFLLAEKAISTDQSRKFVYVVNAEGKVEYREVKLGGVVDGQRVVLSGLAEGDSVLVNSQMRVRPGMPVQAVPAERMETMSSGVTVGEAMKPIVDDTAQEVPAADDKPAE